MHLSIYKSPERAFPLHIDRPFTESKEVIGGFTLLQANSK